MARTFTKLSRPAMRQLKPGEQINEHGITYEKLANNDGRFTVGITVDGVRIHRVIGKDSDGTTRNEAEEFIAKARQDSRAGRLNLPKARKLSLNLQDASARYLEKLESSGGLDIPKKRQRLNLHVVPFLGSLPLSKVSSFDLERYKKHRQEQGAKAGTINRELAAVSHLFSKSEEWGWIDRRPAKINRLREDSGRVTYLALDQIKRLLECAKEDQNAQIYPFIVIGLETSMRMMEILRIRREDVHLERLTITIPRAKAGPREQPITSHLADFLKRHIEALDPGSAWLFPSIAAKEGHTVDIRDPFVRVVLAAGLDPHEVHRHTLRHTAITHLVQAGVDLPTVQRISGHKTLIMVSRYAHANGEHIQTAMDKLEERYRMTS